MAFWRVDNTFGSFLPADTGNMSLIGKPYDLRHMIFGNQESAVKSSKSSSVQDASQYVNRTPQLERSSMVASGRLYEATANFKLIWWNNGTNSRKKLSIWRPMIPHGMVFLGDIAVDGYGCYDFTIFYCPINNIIIFVLTRRNLFDCRYEPPNSAIVLRDTGDETLLKAPQDFELAGHIKRQRGVEGISFWYPQAPPGFVAMGCIASKGVPKEDIDQLRCIRSDMVTGDQFPEQSIWDSSDSRVSGSFSLWGVGNDLGTFLVRSGFRKPPRRFALKLAYSTISGGSDTTVIDAEIKAFSAVAFDDYGGLVSISQDEFYLVW